MAELTIPQWAQIAQIGSAFIASVALIILVWQLGIQNRLSKAQVLRHRFDMYWQTYTPITAEQILDFHQNPEDYMTLEKYQRCKGDDAKIRKYIMLAKQFEYLAFLFALGQLGIKDPLGTQWLPLWTKDLSLVPEFLELKDFYRAYYPSFSDYVDKPTNKK